MTTYAGFRDLQDYLDKRLARDELTQNSLSEALKLRRNYIHGIYHGHFKPSRNRCDEISRHFGDDPHILRILVGLESPPPDLRDRSLREIYDLASSLSDEKRRQAVKLLRDLSNDS
jgi:hypothetical protein